MAHKKDCSSGIEDPAADVSLMPDLSEDEKKQLLEVMQRAKEFEAQEEKYLMRQPLEGQLYKYTNVMKGFQYRWFVVDPESGCLGYYEKEEHKRQKPRGSVHLAGAVVSPSDEDSQTFTVNAANGEIYRLRAHNAKERQYWVDRLRATAEYQLQTMAQNAPPLSGQLRHHSFPPGHLTSGRPKTGSSESLPTPASTSSAPTSKMLPPSCAPSDVVVAKQHATSTTASSDIVASSQTSNQFTKTNKSEHHKQQVPMSSHTSDAFRGTKEMLAQVRHHHHNMSTYISDLPSNGDSITCLDQEMLLLKATSSATLNCLEECLSILKQQQLAGCHGPNRPSDIDWTSEREAVRDSGGEMISPTDSFVSLTSVLEDIPEAVTVNHTEEVEDEAEYSDTDLEGVEDHKNVILQLLSQLKLGMDLTKVVLPTFILEKRSLLEMFADCMAHPDDFLQIPDFPDPESRMLAVVEWYLTSFHAARKGSIAKKPYNPIIGETFHCSWVLPSSGDASTATDTAVLAEDQTEGNADHTGDGESGEEGDSSISENGRAVEEGRMLYFCAEQVSHHPPISAFYFESPKKQIYMDGSIWTRSKFMGMSIGVTMIGKVQITLLEHEEEYELSLPSAYARSILTVPWVELGDRITISCKKTGYSAAVAFQTKPFYGGKLNKITSEVRNPGGEIVCKVIGEWNGTLEFTYANGETKVVDTETLKTVRKCVRPISAQSNFESRRLWQSVTDNLKKGDVDTATQHKRFLEERQRQAERHRQAVGSPFPTKYFHKDGENWVFNLPLKQGQTQPSV
ncbi:Oxysterol-binding protein-related protein 11 [Lamellibrachia satsuma]|nr:Oxysterol-binding protein-related protein 11 [Lamellibrachia satsuma]